MTELTELEMIPNRTLETTSPTKPPILSTTIRKKIGTIDV
jgi:hypothetical protein